MDACRIAGLEVGRIINEPTAAALAYGLDQQQADMKRVFVFDLGGGTFDVSILEIENGLIDVKATRGDSNLGGTDIDEILLKHCIQDFKQTFGIDLTGNNRATSRLRRQCEKAKHDLSFSQSAYIECEALSSDNDFSLQITRA